ncbi:membrane protein DedA, SNARE-associated domain [Amycolatopsis marina]|uniref:Membrane protein DedA, SNARE-associated domain n=1 Tax=Amycolatopsis marina TaxID=490629 RepID=A0A1I0XH10_9PSEU|nr:DedA family protein [Amycolatopsis marina]SFA99977.1 membrane protein DedA, SNARE-associated domain [Amycolatopsis marina]
MLDLLYQLTDTMQGALESPWLWLIVFAVAGLDALLPFMPSEATVITVAVLLGPDAGKLALLWLIAMAGAFAGDCLGYGIGRAAGPHALRRLQRGERGRERYTWARMQVDRHAPTLIIAGRYLPGGRVASGLATGSLRFPLTRFAALDLVGVSIWAAYSVAIGYLGGAGFAGEPAKGLLLAFVIGLLIVAGIEVGRRLRSRRAARRPSDRAERPQRRAADGGGRHRTRRGGFHLPGLDRAAARPARRQGAVVGACQSGRPER